MFSNRALLENIQDSDEPIYVYLSGGATHCSRAVTPKNIGDVYLHQNRLSNILSCVKVKHKHNITYDDMGKILPSIHPINRSNFEGKKRGYILS